MTVDSSPVAIGEIDDPDGVRVSFFINGKPFHAPLVDAVEKVVGSRFFPAGGTTGQYLIKASNADYDTTWHTLTLATVATTGAYADLTGKPTLGTAAAGSSNDFKTECIAIACSDETTALTTGTNKVRFRMPFAMTLSAVRASLSTAQSSGSIFTVDINESGTTVLSTKLTVDNTEKTSTTAATAAVISDSSLADDAEMSVDIDQIGNGTATGLKVYLIGIRA